MARRTDELQRRFNMSNRLKKGRRGPTVRNTLRKLSRPTKKNCPTANRRLAAPDPQKDPFLQLVSLQKASGCWELDATLAGVFGKTEDELTNQKPAQVDGSVWATLLALIWLYGCKIEQQVEWQFVAMKAASWIGSQKVPLKSISVEVRVQDHVATVSSTLQYVNEEERPLEALFVFPLPADAAVCHFSAKIGEQEIVAEVQERETARDQYDDAVSSGQQAFLLEESEESPDVFRLSVGCLSPGQNAAVTIIYVTELAVQADHSLRFCLPAVLNPRYTPADKTAQRLLLSNLSTSKKPSATSWGKTASPWIQSPPTLATRTTPAGQGDLKGTEITSQALKASSPPFIPQATPVPIAVTQLQQNSDLVSILAEAISANHLPTPEPAMFTGDPLKFKDWQLSFETLIERKNIPKMERLYYLRKYLGGSAKKAVEGYLLVGTDEAYDSAWQLLEKRFGDPFTIGKCFRDKLHSWPKISSKDGCELREFADFLKSCEAAMPRIKTLEVLNDCMESQRILLKLPDWLVSRWRRDKCQKRHPTCLHDDKFTEREETAPVKTDESQDKTGTQVKVDPKDKDVSAIATTNRVAQESPSTLTSSILPVWVSSTKNPGQEVLVYALLDSQSDTSFILDEVAQDLDTDKNTASLRLSTMYAKLTVIPCEKLLNLQVRGYHSKQRIALPPVFTREFIPANKSHIPTFETALKWPHLERLADKLPPLLEYEVGLLIGYNCQQALLPREVLAGTENQPYAQLTDFGWSIVGCSYQVHNQSDVIGTSHRVIVREVTPTVQQSVVLKQEVHFVCRTQVKEVTPL
ncbi:von Willebrand factor A domain-containing protein 5A [Anabarilius grahami]|uniref:von Willebrand factor A domain-containing protein 5A n=1 Tax=Anabarilius grahami TaxID=495550 RepID=A0A3N0XIM8_ANAGA|nr:von Willebrand factor A domain-containing protein 5A [Anabarilius grahami]